MSVFAQYFKASSISAVAKLFTSFGALLVIWLINHIAGKEVFGLIMLSFALNYILATALAAFFQSPLLYHVSRTPDDHDENTARLSHYILGLLLLGVLVAFAEVLFAAEIAQHMQKPELALVFQSMAMMIPCFALNSLISNYYRAQQNIVMLVTYFEILPTAIRIVCFSGLLLFDVNVDLDVVWLGAVFVASYGLPGVAIAIKARVMPKFYARFWDGWDLSYAAKSMVAQLVNKSTRNLVVFILGFFVSAAAIADLSVAIRFGQFLQMPKLAFIQLQKPRIGQWMAKHDMAGLLREYRALQGFSTLATVLGAIVFIFALPFVLPIFGDYESAMPLLYVLAVASVIRSGFGGAGEYIGMAGRAGQGLFVNIVSAVVIAIALFILVPMFGIMGGAYALVLGAFCSMGLMGVLIWRDDRFAVLNMAMVIAMGMGVMGLMVHIYMPQAVTLSVLLLLAAGGVLVLDLYRRFRAGIGSR